MVDILVRFQFDGFLEVVDLASLLSNCESHLILIVVLLVKDMDLQSLWSGQVPNHKSLEILKSDLCEVFTYSLL